MVRLINENDQSGDEEEEPIVNPRSPRTLEATLRAKKRKLKTISKTLGSKKPGVLKIFADGRNENNKQPRPSWS